MGDMSERYKDLPPDTGNKLVDLIKDQGRESLEFVTDLDRKLTNTNLLTNGGGAVATLAFIGQQPEGFLLKISLLCFAVGVVLTGFEIRAMMRYFGDLGFDASRRLRGFLTNDLTVADVATVSKSVGKWPRRVNHWAGVLSQGLFLVGVLIGAMAAFTSVGERDDCKAVAAFAYEWTSSNKVLITDSPHVRELGLELALLFSDDPTYGELYAACRATEQGRDVFP